MKIAVGLSGGVDSSVVASLLKEQGHEVVGVTMKLWSGRYRGGDDSNACFGPAEAEHIERAAAIAEQIGIEYRVFDCSEEYEKNIIEYFRTEYLAGRTPNPCVRCNAMMKFGLLPEAAKKEGVDFDYFATGHYARIVRDDAGCHLFQGLDLAKDQSYFLYRLTQKQLARQLFPLGEYTKEEVRKLAARFGLLSKDRPDSQDFYSGDYSELLQVADKAGDIVDENGKILGKHRGFWHYTVGQRKGIGIAAPRPLYVLELNACRNEVIVGYVESVRHHHVEIADCNWILSAPEGECEVKIRSSSRLVKAVISGARITFAEDVLAAAKGQSAVIYRDGEVLGGGIIA